MFGADPFSNPKALVERVYSYVAYRIGDGPDAEDVTSDALERAVRYRHAYDRSKGDPATWAIGIARRCVSDFLHLSSPGALNPETAEAGDDLEDRVVRRLALAQAVA